MKRSINIGYLAPAFLCSSAAFAGDCAPEYWDTVIGQPGMNSSIQALAAFDDGSGVALYAGGGFTIAGGEAANFIAKWDGSWSPLGSGMGGIVRALTVYDDGSGGGEGLYVGGFFTTAGEKPAKRIAKWDGESWSPLGSGTDGPVRSLAVFDDGTGPALYAGGLFTTAGGQAASNIAKWDGESWSPLGSGMDGPVQALAVFDDGSGGGQALYAGGNFTVAGEQAANSIAKWNGSSWSPLGEGVSGEVIALTVFDDGDDPALYVGGNFTIAGGQVANNIATWDGSLWSPVGDGVNGSVRTLTEFDDGAGPAVYAGGIFTAAGEEVANRIVKWDGESWSPMSSGMNNTVAVLAVFNDGSEDGPTLYAGGTFTTSSGQPANRIAMWRPSSSWLPLGSGMNNSVFSLTEFDDGTGPALYAGGNFTTAGGVPANRIAKWDGESWSTLDSGMESTSTPVSPVIYALTVFDDGSGGGGQALYAGGNFTVAGEQTINRIAKWDGSSWSALCSGVDWIVRAMTAFDDGSGGGQALYAGGQFTTAGGEPANRIAKWDGNSWSPVGSGTNSSVLALTVLDDGTGPALYAGGTFTAAGGQPANFIAKWNGSSWSPLSSGMNHWVLSMTVFDDGTGKALYAAGHFTSAGGEPANYIAKWDGSSWSPLGSGLNGTVRALTVFDNGTGPTLYAGGDFTIAGSKAAPRIAKWDGVSWSHLEAGVDYLVYALTVSDDGTEDTLYAGGAFSVAGGQLANRIARWGCLTEPNCIFADLNCDGIVNVFDLLELLANWGDCVDCDNCPADLDDNCTVNVFDLLELLANWG